MNKISIDLSFNKLKTIDLLVLIKDNFGIRLNLNLSNNHIDTLQLNEHVLKLWKRAFQFDILVKFIIEKIVSRAYFANTIEPGKQNKLNKLF